MKKTLLLTSAGIALVFAAILCSGINVAFAQWTVWDMDTDPASIPGTRGTWVVSAVAGNRVGGYANTLINWWSGSYWDISKKSSPCGPMYYTWILDGDYYENSEEYLIVPGYIGDYVSGGTYYSAASLTSQQFGGWEPYFYWTYSCGSAI